MGEEGIRDELTAAGIASVGVGCDPFPEGAPDKLIPQVPQDPDIRAVILGYDHWVSLPKLVKVPTPICSFLSPSRLFRPQACTYASHVEPHFFLASRVKYLGLVSPLSLERQRSFFARLPTCSATIPAARDVIAETRHGMRDQGPTCRVRL